MFQAGLCWELEFEDTPLPPSLPRFPLIPVIPLVVHSPAWPAIEQNVRTRLAANHVEMSNARLVPPTPTHARSPQACMWHHLKTGNKSSRKGILGDQSKHRHFTTLKFGDGLLFTGEQVRESAKDDILLQDTRWHVTFIGKRVLNISTKLPIGLL